MERLNPLNDYLFTRLMGEAGDEEQLLVFLNAILARTHAEKLTAVEIIENKILTAEVIGDKTSVLDIRASTGNNTRVNIEIQLRNQHQMDRRSLFYWSREYSKGIDSGDDYSKLPNVIAINILNHEFIPLKDFHTIFHLREDTHPSYILTSALEIHFIEMVKFRRLKEKDIQHNILLRWLSFFDPNTPPTILEEVINMDSTLQKVQEKLTRISSDKETLRAYHMREMALSDWTTSVNAARIEGRIEGRTEGIKVGKDEGKDEGRSELRDEVIKLWKSGVSFDEAIKILGKQDGA
jgi:predicted transposase/invertase (TIGR01784 family)